MSLDRRRLLEELRALRLAANQAEHTEQTAVRGAYHASANDLLRGVSRQLKGHQELDLALLARARRFIQVRTVGVMQRTTAPLLTGSRASLLTGTDATARCTIRLARAGAPLTEAERSSIARLCERQLDHQRRLAAHALSRSVQQNLAREVFGPGKTQTTKALLGSLERALGKEGWKIERTVRTEASSAFNLGQQQAIIRLAEQGDFRGRLYKRWTELISDLTGRPFDNRVAEDSLHMHGQVALPGALFTMPTVIGTTRRLTARLAGRVWSHPPNRPNDRAILVPWMQGWGIPGWVWRGGRVAL